MALAWLRTNVIQRCEGSGSPSRSLRHVASNRSRRNSNADFLQQFIGDTLLAPGGIAHGHFRDQLLQAAGIRGRPCFALDIKSVGPTDGAGVRTGCFGVSALLLSDANSGSHRRSVVVREISRLPRPAIAASSRGSGSAQPTPQTRRILTVDRRPSSTCPSTPDGFGPISDGRVQIHVRPGKSLFLMPEVPFDAAVGAASPPTPLRKTAFDSPTL